MSITTWTGIDPANRITRKDPVDLKGYVGVMRDADQVVSPSRDLFVRCLHLNYLNYRVSTWSVL